MHNLDFTTDLPSGYDTVYEGTSVQLSGGQMQRLAIAQALLRNPRLLILEDGELINTPPNDCHQIWTILTFFVSHICAWSNVGTARSSCIEKHQAEKKITTITIAHRLTNVIDSDAIAVIDNGSIAELGDHGTLLQTENGIYRSLC